MGAVARTLRNPWRKPYFLKAFTWVFLAWSLAPLVVAALFSFNDGLSRTSWQGFSWQWYFGLPGESLFQSPELGRALLQTLRLGFITAAVAVPLGTAFAIGMDRWRGRSIAGRFVRDSGNGLMVLAFMIPEIVLGISLFFAFAEVLKFVHLGTAAQAAGLIMMTVPYPAIIVRARLLSIDRHHEESAMDLGASPTQALRLVLMPLLYPAIALSTALVLARAIDDLVVARYLAASSSSVTLTMKIYGGFRSAPTPVYNAMATVMTLMTLAMAGVAYSAFRRLEAARRT